MVDVGRFAAELAGRDPVQQVIEGDGLQLDRDIRVSLGVLGEDLLERILLLGVPQCVRTTSLTLSWAYVVRTPREAAPKTKGEAARPCANRRRDTGVMNMRLPVLSLVVILIS